MSQPYNNNIIIHPVSKITPLIKPKWGVTGKHHTLSEAFLACGINSCYFHITIFILPALKALQVQSSFLLLFTSDQHHMSNASLWRSACGDVPYHLEFWIPNLTLAPADFLQSTAVEVPVWRDPLRTLHQSRNWWGGGGQAGLCPQCWGLRVGTEVCRDSAL